SWRLYWMRASGKWEKYDAFYHLEQALEAAMKDQYGCFWGVGEPQKLNTLKKANFRVTLIS
ncbi:DUF3024 domain-containing protein, partial [Vibrio chagasii]|uniref:DUF3024 domain-containing protein n=1 Tax=Vibrio chagasii TaxID=170679 RepID=UPI002283D2A0